MRSALKIKYGRMNDLQKWFAFAILVTLLFPLLSHAAVTGGGMPYSPGIATLSRSVQTEIAALLMLIAIVCGVGGYIIAGQMEGLFNVIGRCMVGVGIIGGVTSFIALSGATVGAII